MAKKFFGIGKFLRMFKEGDNSVHVDILHGTAAPGGDTGPQDDAAVGSLFILQDGANSKIYQKVTDTDAAADWNPLLKTSNLLWRPEKVIAATNDTLAAGSAIDPTAWTDNESGIDGDDIPNGTYVIGDVDGVATLFEKTAQVSATSITLAAVSASLAIKDNSTYIIQNYLPDTPADQEKQAIIHFPTAGAAGVKLGDFNWAKANGIDLNGLAVVTGLVLGSDTVQVAIEKLEKGLVDTHTALGIARNALNFGAFTSPVDLLFSSTASAKALFQRIGELLMNDRGVQVTPVTTLQTIDSVATADVKHIAWLVEAFEIATPANRESAVIVAMTDGTAVDDTEFGKLDLGAGNIASFSVAISGADMLLQAVTGTAGITVTARRIPNIKTLL